MNRIFAGVGLWGVVCLTACLGACSPTFNWREIRLEPAALLVMLPCKPDQGTRQVTLAAQNLSLHMIGCVVDGATFAVSYADLADASQAAPVLAQWKTAMLGTMRATQIREVPIAIKGVDAAPAVEPVSRQVQAQGTQADGQAVVAHGVWFAKNRQVFHAVVYGDRVSPDVLEAFFSGLQLQ
ncbi:MAG: hypothetical protein RIS34_1051 [Pseudomonadota bacterium]|jgi:hypothetical protein